MSYKKAEKAAFPGHPWRQYQPLNEEAKKRRKLEHIADEHVVAVSAKNHLTNIKNHKYNKRLA